MAATPEQFLQDGGHFLANAELLSPSLFLDLPPTPTHDLHLDFISCILMEEDIHDKFFYQYPDHPAILSAQRPFAQIISDSNTSTHHSVEERSPVHSEDKRVDSVATAAGQSSGSSMAFSNGGVEKKLKQSLLNTGMVVKESKKKPMATSPAGQDVLASAFFNGRQTDSDMVMLNMAFRKGMEEANKFLPTNSTPLSDLDAISDKRGFIPRSHVKKDGFGTLMFGNGRDRKKRHRMEDLEAETGKNSKLMAREQEEIGEREMVDEILLHGMEDLHIGMVGEAEKTGKAARGKRGTIDEVVDLRAMLIHCAQAVASGDRRGSNELLRQIKQHSSPKGDATQRLACCFAEGLEARLAGTGSQVYQSVVTKRTSVVEYLKAYRLYMEASSILKVNMAFVGKTIFHAMEGKSRLHIVDYTVHYGFHWPDMLKCLATREGGPPEVRITGIDLPRPEFRPAFHIEETGRRLSNLAREFGLPFKFHGIVAKLETVCAEDLNIDPDEVLAVLTRQSGSGHLMDEAVVVDKQDSPSPRDMVLTNIRKMRPDVFIEFVVNGTYGAPFFVTRFREALFFYSTLFDMLLDATIPRDNEERQLIERDILGRYALNAIACEGADRVDRPETYKQWQVRSHRAGLRQLPLNPEVIKVVTDKRNNYHKDFVIDVDRRWLLLGWKGRILYGMSAWVAAEDNNSKF